MKEHFPHSRPQQIANYSPAERMEFLWSHNCTSALAVTGKVRAFWLGYKKKTTKLESFVSTLLNLLSIKKKKKKDKLVFTSSWQIQRLIAFKQAGQKDT